MGLDPSIFKAYDVRGIYPDQINEEAAYRIGWATSKFLNAKTIAVGRDMRLSSPALAKALIEGITSAGTDAVDLGMIGTDMYYMAVPKYGYDGGIVVTASHNPKEWNGMKFIRAGAVPISSDTGLKEIKELSLNGNISKASVQGKVYQKDIYEDYVQHVLSFIDPSKIKPYKIVMDPGNGMGGYIASHIFKHLPCQIIPMNFEPDGTFPNHEPNPMLEENQGPIVERVLAEKADLGVMWDGDADRCFLVDSNGRFVEGYFITALLAEAVLRKKPGATILCDPRNIWAVVDTVRENGGRLVINKAGHSFLKEAMRRENAAFGGEMSGHYYFQENYCADSGMIPVLMILELMSEKGKSLAELVEPLRSKYFISGEINSEVEDAQAIIAKLKERYSDGEISLIDGLSVEYPDWRFNVRPSNTEPLLRLNVEARSKELMEQKRDELLAQIRGG